MTVFAEKTSLAFVLAQGKPLIWAGSVSGGREADCASSTAYDPMTKQKAPKAQADALTWIKQSILDFGIDGLALKDLVQFLKAALGSANGAVRTSATAVLVTVSQYVGSGE